MRNKYVGWAGVVAFVGCIGTFNQAQDYFDRLGDRNGGEIAKLWDAVIGLYLILMVLACAVAVLGFSKPKRSKDSD